MPSSEKSRRDPQRLAPERRSVVAQPGASALVVVTIDPAAGAVVRLESEDGEGVRHDLSPEEVSALVGAHPQVSLDGLMRQAFEAGIACVLDDASAGSEAEEPEAEDEAQMRDLLLDALIETTAAKRLMAREVLRQAAVSVLIRDAAGGPETRDPPIAAH